MLQDSGLVIEPRSQGDPLFRVDSGELVILLFVITLLFVVVPGMLFGWWMRAGDQDRGAQTAGREVACNALGIVWRLADRPIQVMRCWAAGPQRICWPILAVFLHVTAVGFIQLLMLDFQTSVVGAAATVVFAGIGALGTFAMHAGALVVIDFVAAGRSGRARLLVELSALVYWTQFVWSASVLMILLAFGSPPSGDVSTAIDVTRQLWTVWLIGLHATVLHVVSGFTVAGTWASAGALGALFLGLPMLTG